MTYDALWTVLGVALLLAVMADSLWTTLTVSGAGLLTTALSWAVGTPAMRGPKPVAENATVLALGGSFLAWLGLLWVGWTLVFCGAPGAVLEAKSSAPASLTGRFYFAGYTLTTLGLGDLIPGGGGWRLATVVAAANGFVTLTLAVTYTFSVLTALNERRALGTAVGHLAGSPEAAVLLLRDGGAQALSSRLLSLTARLEQAAIQQDAFPVLQYSHVADLSRSFARGVVLLGEAALLLEHAVAEDRTLPVVVRRPLRRAVDRISGDRRGDVRRPDPPLPPLDRLAAALPLRSGAAEAFGSGDVAETRTRWAAFLRWHGRDWSALREPDGGRDAGGSG